MKLKKLISAACSAAMLTALVPAQTVSNAAGVPPMETYISDIKVVGATGTDDGSDEDCVALINKTNPDAPSLKKHFWCDIHYSGNHPDNYLDTSYYGRNNFGFICEWNVNSIAPAEFNGHTYQSIDKHMTWEDAKRYCESLGGHLVTITNEEEQQFLYQYMLPRISSFYWIGATLDVDDSVKWVTNEESDYTRFISYQENDAPEKETPILMWSNTAFWKTCDEADNDTGFICECEKKPSFTFNRHKYKLFNYSTNWDDAA
ncbi:MAG: C-type lectin domain-containing protein [Ruminococcus sp.]|nr:C-type lectin domain-containing protein [Ruminococcus sp.]